VNCGGKQHVFSRYKRLCPASWQAPGHESTVLISSALSMSKQNTAFSGAQSSAKHRSLSVFSGHGEAGAGGLVPYTTTRTGPQLLPDRPGCLSFSQSAARLARMKHHVRTAGRLMSETLGRDEGKYYAVFLTLTYRDAGAWDGTHLTAFFHRVRSWASRKGFRARYVWVAELQKRGAIHYHGVIWLPRGLKIPKADRRGWWVHGSTNVKAVKKNAVGYLMKYVSKGVDGRNFPKGARICGSAGLDAPAADEFHWWRLPRFVREAFPLGSRVLRAPGGGWYRRGGDGQIVHTDWGLHVISKVGNEKFTVLRQGAVRKSCQKYPVSDDVISRYWDVFYDDLHAQKLKPWEQCVDDIRANRFLSEQETDFDVTLPGWYAYQTR
jgi:hypothetical protein